MYSGLERISESLESPISRLLDLIANRLTDRAHNLHITTIVITSRPGVWHMSLDASNTTADTTTIGSGQTIVYPSLILDMSLDESNITATTGTS